MKRRVFLGAVMSVAASSVAYARQAKPNATKPPAKAPQSEATKVLAIQGATLHTGAGDVIDDATILVQGGLVLDVVKGGSAPTGADAMNAKGLVVTPGLVECLSSIGAVEVDLEPATHDDEETSKKDRIHAAFRVADGYNPASVVVEIARAGGLTSAGVVPRGGLVAGQSAWVDLDGSTAADAIVKAPLALHVDLAATSGEAHAENILRVREAFDDARTFVKNKAAWERNQSRAFVASRLDMEALALALDKKLPVVFHIDRAADITSAIKMADEIKLKPIVAGGAEAWRVASELAAAKVPVVTYPLVDGPANFDAIAARDDNAALLAKAGVLVAISSGETHNARKLRQVAGNAVRAGLPHAMGVQAVTSAPAIAFGLDAKVGALKKGKVANLVVWSGDPLELSTRALAVFIRGKSVSLKNRQTELLDKYRRLVPRHPRESLQ